MFRNQTNSHSESPHQIGKKRGKLPVISEKVIPHPSVPVVTGSGGGVKVDYWQADILQSTDYSPFGVTLQGRNFTASGADGFRFGFQGQEMDDEIKGEGNSVNYEYRMHDPRLGRFFAIDPLSSQYSYNSSYAFSENVVIDHVELEGLEKKKPDKCWDGEQGVKEKRIRPHRGKIEIYHARTIIETVNQPAQQNFAPEGLNTGLNQQFSFNASGTFNFNAFNIQDGITITNTSTGAIVFQNNLQQNATGPIVVPQGNYQVQVVPNTKPANAGGNTQWTLNVTDNSQYQKKKTRYCLFGILPVYTKVEEQYVDLSGNNMNSPITVRRKVFGLHIPGMSQTKTGTIRLTMGGAVGRQRNKWWKMKSMPKY